jgi:hypothetical protein
LKVLLLALVENYKQTANNNIMTILP